MFKKEGIQLQAILASAKTVVAQLKLLTVFMSICSCWCYFFLLMTFHFVSSYYFYYCNNAAWNMGEVLVHQLLLELLQLLPLKWTCTEFQIGNNEFLPPPLIPVDTMRGVPGFAVVLWKQPLPQMGAQQVCAYYVMSHPQMTFSLTEWSIPLIFLWWCCVVFFWFQVLMWMQFIEMGAVPFGFAPMQPFKTYVFSWSWSLAHVWGGPTTYTPTALSMGCHMLLIQLFSSHVYSGVAYRNHLIPLPFIYGGEGCSMQVWYYPMKLLTPNQWWD